MTDGSYKLPSGWRWVRLGEVCEVIIGGTPRRGNEKYWGPSHTWVTIGDMHDRFICSSKETITDSGVKDSNVKLIARGTVLLSFKLTIGKVTIAGRELYTNEAIAALPVKAIAQALLDRDYLFWVLQGIPLDKTSDLAAKGRTLNKRKLVDIPIPLPLLAEQQRIVARVEALMERVREAKRLRGDTVGESDKLTSSALVEELRRLCSLYPCHTIHELRAKGELEILGGGTPSKKNKAFWEGDVPWVSPKDMKCWVIADTEDHISSEAIDASSTKMIRAGAVLVVVRGMILARRWPIAIAGIDLTINQDMKALLPRDGIHSEYLGYILRGLEPQVLEQVETAAHGTRRLKSDTLEALRIPIAPITEQQRLVAYIDSVQAQSAALKRAQEDTDAELRRLEQAILERAFRGEL